MGVCEIINVYSAWGYMSGFRAFWLDALKVSFDLLTKFCIVLFILHG